MDVRGKFDIWLFLSRARAKIKRAFIRKFVRLDKFSPLETASQTTSSPWIRGEKYTESCSVEMLDDQNGLTWKRNYDERFFYTIHNVVLDSISGYLFNEDGKIIKESAAWQDSGFFLNSPAIPIKAPPIPIDVTGKTVFSISGGNFYHWTIEELSLALPIIKTFPNPIALIYEKPPQFLESILPMLNIEILRVPRFVKLNACTFISKNSIFGHPHPKDVETVRNFFSPLYRERIQGKKIFISRLKSTRSPKFEAKLLEKLKHDDWEIIYSENLSLPEQIEKISTASVLAGVHGAGLTGIMWLDPKAKVIELSSLLGRTCFVLLSQARNIEHHRIPYKEGAPKSAEEIFEEINMICGNLDSHGSSVTPG